MPVRQKSRYFAILALTSCGCSADWSCPTGHREVNGACVSGADASAEVDASRGEPDAGNPGLVDAGADGSDGEPDATMPTCTGTEEVCDGADNDCDGKTDEAGAINAQTWYQDCDGDGYAPSTDGSVKSCNKPANAGSCTWTSVIPQESSKVNWDCNDTSAAYSPAVAVTEYGFPPDGLLSYDLNCNGVSEKAPDAASGAPTPCNNAVVAVLNTPYWQEECANGVDGCIVWLIGAGRYTNTPPSVCPDVNGERVKISPGENQAGDPIYRCYLSADMPTQWPCR